MAKSTPVAVNFKAKNPETVAALDKLGAMLDRDRSYLLNEALENYVELHQWQIARIQNGLEQVAQGKLASQTKIDKLLGRKK
ncbi:MAG: ribbon-helix-helix protein, CopG family [Bdellovibrio sp.]